MGATKSGMKMAELLIFARSIASGFLLAEVWRIAFYLGTSHVTAPSKLPFGAMMGMTLAALALCSVYAVNRGALATARRMACSLRVDLLVAAGVGVWANELAAPWLVKIHGALKVADPQWAPMILVLLSAILLSPLVQRHFPRPKKADPQLHFIADEEIGDEHDDLLASETQAKSFAEAVLESGAHPGLVFGIDGPWGVGKTSFINLAERHWELAADRVIVCRFEPLRYASESDLADRMIRDLSAAIQRQVFAPEFRPTASRYSRLIKGKADFSFLGFKLSLEPGQETVDELLDDIDEVLKRIGRRAIFVVDDLDRLDAKTINSVLFATRRTFKLSQATYVLCYDTEVLASNKEDGARAREFLEKFVTVKLSLFVDSSRISQFLRRDWQREESQLASVPSDTMLKLGAVLNELADVLDGELAAKYLPLVGDLRKVKRFVNAMLLMQIEKSDLGRTDFNKRDLINLMLLHLSYPGMFRRIYAEETEGRSGTFSVRRLFGEREYKNEPGFSKLVAEEQEVVGFLLRQIFEVETLGVGGTSSIDEKVLTSRACFNHGSSRNLEKYLKLIVRFVTPEPRETFVLYQDAVDKVRKGAAVASILTARDFNLEEGDYPHDQFWRVFVNQSHELTRVVADDAISTLVEYLPKYSSIGNEDRGLRQRSIYSLLRLLDRAGWGGDSVRGHSKSEQNVVEIAWRIFGEGSHEGGGIIQRLASDDRGVLGWNDLMLFRLQCSADRQGSLHNLTSALILDQDVTAATAASSKVLALTGMRRLSQEIFALFKRTYIHSRRNFCSETEVVLDDALLGDAMPWIVSNISSKESSGLGFPSLSQLASVARSNVKYFVLYQLSNSTPPGGAGVGCGYYDEFGVADAGEIARQMNKYVFGFCFNPAIEDGNSFIFLDYCLLHLTGSFFSGDDDGSYTATRSGILGGFAARDMAIYWVEHQDEIREKALQAQDRQVLASGYTVSYREGLGGVFAVLDALVDEITAEDVKSKPPT
jgi:hypothetical protein